METEEILQNAQENCEISEREIMLLKRRKNDGKEIDESLFWNEEIKCEPEQFEKGLAWLKNQWQTPKGAERKNNPFGYREQKIIETAKHFTFDDFYNAGNAYQNYYVPIYALVGKENSFQYYVNGKGIQIIG